MVGKERPKAVLLGAWLLGAAFSPICSSDASARSIGPPRCAHAPTSSSVVNVKDKGATADDQTDDTAAIQAAIDEIAATGGTVFVPDGTYMVNAEPKNWLTLKSDMTLKLSPGATLKAIPTRESYYAILSIAGVSNVAVVGGTLEGEREGHLGKSGEWGVGIRIERGARHITVRKVTAKKMWGDGFYVEGAADVALCSITADDNRRQGLSIIDADGLLVTNSVFTNTRGTRPSSGIDLEPDRTSQRIANVRIQNSEFLGNAGAGILIDGGKGPVADVEIINNAFTGNARPIKIKHAPALASWAICHNRQAPSDGLFASAGPIPWPWMRSSSVLHSSKCKSLPAGDALVVAR